MFFLRMNSTFLHVDEAAPCPTCGQALLDPNSNTRSNGLFRLNQFAIMDNLNDDDFVQATPRVERNENSMEIEMSGDPQHENSKPTDVHIEYDLESGQLIFIDTSSIPNLEGRNFTNLIPAMFIEKHDNENRVINLDTL